MTAGRRGRASVRARRRRIMTAAATGISGAGLLWAGMSAGAGSRTTTVAYTATTAATRNPALVLAGIATSALFGLERRTCGGVVAPALSHVTWSLLMLRYLPPLFRAPPGTPARG